MSVVSFLAKRISSKGNKSVSKLALRLAIFSIALGIAVMEISISVVEGFENEIKNKLIGFVSHIQLGAYLPEANNEARPLTNHSDYANSLKKDPRVVKIAPYINFPALIKSKESMEGVMLKGVDTSWNSTFFTNALKEGKLPDLSVKNPYEVLISRKIANILSLQVNQKAKMYFLGEKTRARVVKIAGIYETGLAEFDQMVVIGSLQLNQKILNWDENEIEGYDVFLKDNDKIIEIAQEFDKNLPMEVRARPIQELYPEIFDWIKLQHQNVWFILILMIAIAIINMSSALIVRIVERTTMIGLLKAMGMTNRSIRNVFVQNAAYIILVGVLLGNVLGLGLLKIQKIFEIIRLDPDSYFVYTVPVAWAWSSFFLLNLGVVFICILSMYLPTLVVQQIQPVKALKF